MGDPSASFSPSGVDQLDVASGRFRQPREVVTVDRHDVVPIDGEHHHTGIDDIRQPGSTEELPSSPTERLVERAHLDPGERLGQASLTWAAAPDPSEHPGVGHREISLELRRLQADPHRTFVTLQRDQGAAVENEGHAIFAVRVAGRPRPRTTVASRRSARRWVAISSAPISPNSCS